MLFPFIYLKEATVAPRNIVDGVLPWGFFGLFVGG
jgi:hypothetical protein